jgi:hypothetical protein
MTRPIARYGVVLGIVALGACAGDPQAPTPIAPPPTTPVAPPTTGVSPVTPPPTPPPTSPSGNALGGSYALTLDLGAGCDVLPEGERIRRYSATIDQDGNGRYLVTLGDASFLTGAVCTAGEGHFRGIGCHQFFAATDLQSVQFFLADNNEWHGAQIVEQLSSGAWIEITGTMSGRSHPRSIEASGPGHVWYCPTSSGYPFPCSRYTFCDTSLRLTLTRR